MLRRSGFHYPDVILAATIEERSRMGVREAYYIAKNLKRDGEEFVEGSYSDKEKVDAALTVCNKIMREEYVSNNLEELIRTYQRSKTYHDNKPLKIKIVFPRPATNTQSANALSLVFVAVLETKLQEALRKRDRYNHMRASVECDYNVRSLVKVGRTVSLSENVSTEENLINCIGLLAKQPLFDGSIEKDTIYLLADDSVRRQSTFANLASFIDSNGGTIGAITALIGVPESAKMKVYPETLKLLQNILSRREITIERINAVITDPDVFGDLNLRIGTQEQNTLTNLETLLLLSYFGNSEDKEEFENVLALAGSTRDENGVISDYLKLTRLLNLERSPGTPEELREIFRKRKVGDIFQ